MRTRSKCADATGFMVSRLFGRILLVGREAIGCLIVADCLTITRRERHLGCQGRCQDELESEHVSDGYAHDAPQPESGFAAKHRVPLGTATTFSPRGTSSELPAKRQKTRRVTTRQQSGRLTTLRSGRRTDCAGHRQALASLRMWGSRCRFGLQLISTRCSHRD